MFFQSSTLPTITVIILTKVYLLITSNLSWLPAAKNMCLVKHAYLYIAFNLQMAEFVYHKERSYYYKKNKQVLGHDIYWQIWNI